MEEEEVKQDFVGPLAKHQSFITPNKNMAASSSATTPHGMQK